MCVLSIKSKVPWRVSRRHKGQTNDHNARGEEILLIRRIQVMSFDISQNYFVPILIPVLIFLARAADVSMAAIRIIFVSRGIRALAAMIGFF